MAGTWSEHASCVGSKDNLVLGLLSSAVAEKRFPQADMERIFNGVLYVEKCNIRGPDYIHFV